MENPVHRQIFLVPKNQAKAKRIFFGQHATKQTLHRLSASKITLNNNEIASSRSYGGQEHFVFLA